MTTKYQIIVKDFSALSFDVFMRTTPMSSPTPSQPRPAPASARDFDVQPEGSANSDPTTTDRREPDKAPILGCRKPARLLIADDSANIRDSLAKVLRVEGYEVELAANGNEALSKFNPETIDLVLLDLDMPVTDGWEAFQRLLGLNPHLAVILITGKEGPREWAHTGEAGTLVEKPIDVPVLLECIRQVLVESPDRRATRLATQRTLTRYTRPIPFLRWQCYSRGGLNE